MRQINQTQARRILHVSYEGLQRLIKDGKLKGKKFFDFDSLLGMTREEMRPIEPKDIEQLPEFLDDTGAMTLLNVSLDQFRSWLDRGLLRHSHEENGIRLFRASQFIGVKRAVCVTVTEADIPEQTNDPDNFSLQDVRQLFGISNKTVQRWETEGRVKARLVDGRITYHADDLLGLPLLRPRRLTRRDIAGFQKRNRKAKS